LSDQAVRGSERFGPLRPTARYLVRTEVHVFGLSIAASVLLSLFPFLHVMVSLCKYAFKWPAAVQAIQFAVADYFPGELGTILSSYLLYPKRIEFVSIVLLLFTANGIFEPLEVALNRAWGITEDRSYIKNQLLSFLLILLCGGLALASFLLTAMNNEFLGKLFGADEPVPRWVAIVIFRLVAIPITMLALFLTYWVLPNCRVPVRRIIPVAIVVGLVLTALQYTVVLLWNWILAKLKSDYGPFAHSSSIILFSFLAAMIVLAGAEWSARPKSKEGPARDVGILPALPQGASR
jgi:membrane protein